MVRREARVQGQVGRLDGIGAHARRCRRAHGLAHRHEQAIGVPGHRKDIGHGDERVGRVPGHELAHKGARIILHDDAAGHAAKRFSHQAKLDGR